VDGKPVGKGEASLTVEPGSHKVRGKDPARGVDVTRSINVPKGTTRSLALDIGTGTLEIDAPDGCEVLVDGKKVGTTPTPPITMVEGKHHVVVKRGVTKYETPFVMKPNFVGTLKVEFRAAGP